MQPRFQDHTGLLSSEDPAPFALTHGGGGWLFSVEHGGHAVPRALGFLGLETRDLTRHIGWDPGAAALARVLARMMDADLIIQPYSRLVVDCNRPRGAADIAALVSDGTVIPGNAKLTEAALDARWEAIHVPFHARLADLCDMANRRGLISIHSYDPQRHSDPARRPWPIGLLFRQANPLAEQMARRLSSRAEALPLGINEPYRIEDASDYTIPVHAEPRGLPHVLVEVRNDHLATPLGVNRMAQVLADALSQTGE
ncbi:N-formylglutamate amidohydrolase [Tabrizicola sp. BL-A-41-H6]|uniref:N-formylglutamate amidohydrolase n=1 Tax=Tabrizicola sp. BL-A-41-H6 TaxID=3421107 RepID=UPI003D667CFB